MPVRVPAPLVGQKFGRLTVLTVIGNYTRCQCTCGTITLPRTYRLYSGHTQSCGCFGQSRAYRHGDTSSVGPRRTPEYGVWENMRARCLRPQNKDYKHYGGRGIMVCDRWRHSYTNFLADMGRRPTAKHTIERKDNSKGYTPENCIWATMHAQHLNKRYLGTRPYWRKTHDEIGECYLLVIPKHLPADWQMPVSD